MSITALWSTKGASESTRAHWRVLVALLPLVPLWYFGMFGREIWTPDEPREFNIAYNMLVTGDVVLPRLAGEPFLEKPPLAYWAGSASMAAMGPSAPVARVPNLIWALLATLCVAVLAADFVPKERRGQAAILAALSFNSMSLIAQTQIWLATDAPLLAFTAAALLSLWRLMQASSPSLQFAWAIAFGTSLAGAFLSKNGVGLLVPGATLLVWLAWERRLGALLRWPVLVAAGWFCLCVGPWLIALLRSPEGSTHLSTLLWDNLVARFLPVESNSDYDLGHRSSHWEFLLSLPVYVLPWTVAWWAAGRWGVRTLRSQSSPTLRSATRFCLAATVPACIVFLLSRTARGVYFGPALIGGALLVAAWLTIPSEQLTSAEQTMHRWTRRTLYALAILLAGLSLVLLAFAGLGTTAVLLLIVAALCIIAASNAIRQLLDPLQRSIAGAASAFILALVCLEAVAFPVFDRSQDLGRLLSQAAPQLPAAALYCGDETTRAVLDTRTGLRLPGVCGADSARALLAREPNQKFLVLLKRPSTKIRLRELFPATGHGTEPQRPPSGPNAAALSQLGLQPLAQWTLPGGRAYALYGAKQE
ncbi:ArnT family glycosyltransferase [Steroidobacter cummioxidans]|uniref:ArnT family glycosyltransferase n=1 Tax=Steroidobacter cummioxidans TaxID=1803913 RepID=UPI00137956BD|nr:glycosyltransferase family 39 protein [Steroidobacter cummioxidans]